MQFLTDVIRKDIYEIIKESEMLLITTTKLFTHKKSNLNFEILLIDYYNSLMIKKRTNTLDEEEINFLNYVNENSVEDLKLLITNLDFIKNALTAMANFYSLSKLDKQNIVKIANEEKDDNDLTKRMLYKLNYMINIPSYKVEDLLNYYKEYIEINGNSLMNHSNGADIIIDYLHDMKEKDVENYEANLLTAIPIFYKWIKYYHAKGKNDEDMNGKRFAYRIEVLKIKELLELTKKDNEFLEDIITQYLLYETFPQNITKEVEEFAEKKLSPKIKRKFKDMKEYKN